MFSRTAFHGYLISVSLMATALAAGVLPVVFSPVANAQTRQTLQLQGAMQANYSRIVLDLPDDVSYSINQRNRLLTISIDGRFDVNSNAFAAVSLQRVGNIAVRRLSGRTNLVFDVLPNITARDFRSGGFVVVDLYGGDLNATLRNAARRVAAVSAGAPSQPTTGGSNSTATASDTSVGTATQSASTGPVQNGAPDNTNVAPGAAGSTGANPGQSDTTDNEASSGAPAGASAGSSAQAGDGAVPQPGTADPVDAAGTDAEAETADNGLSGTSSPMTSVANTESDEEPIVDQSGARERARQQEGPRSTGPTDVAADLRSQVSAIEFGTMEDAVDAANTVTIQTEALEESVKVSFNMPEDAAMAVFERGGSLWTVFDKPFKLDISGLRAGGSEVSRRIRRVEQSPDPDALILRMNIMSNQNFVVEREDNTWHVSLKDTPAKPRFPLRPTRRDEQGQGQQIFIQASDIGRKIEFEDPDIGDILVVLPTLRQSTGVAQKYSYAAAELLETAQGIAISPLSDNVAIDRFRDGVAIRSTGNSLLSASRLSRSTGIGSDTQIGFARLIDFESWRIGQPWEYRKNKSRLLYELSLATAETANDVRWKLARYFLAHGRAAEALGVLEVMLNSDELLEKNGEFRAVRGVANFKQGRLEEAAVDLASPELEAEQDAELWRAVVAEARGKYDDSLEFYRRGKDVMGTYDEFDRAELQLAIVRAAIETGDLELAQDELELMNGLTLTEGQLSETVYQNARIAEIQGQNDIAQTQFDDLTESPERWIAARARYSRTMFGLNNGDIDPETAIDQLERLRYAWRGDRFESLLLDDLADLYFETGQFEVGLETLRQGVSYYPLLAQEKRMSQKMGQIFRSLFLDGMAEEMTPIAAISLYYKFRELTPLGSEGDLMIRRLADRLVSVDLLDRAADLLDYQVKARTEGAARAQIAANLAKIHILNRKPEAALEIIRATREPRLPQDILANRRHVEARALIEMERFEEAEVLIEEDRSADAEILRADIFWGGKNWTQLVPTIRRLLGDGWRRNESLTELQRLNLIRLSISMTFTEDRAGLIEVRRRYGGQMRSGDFANAFELLTNDHELSGRELGAIATQIASVEKLQSFMRDYRNDFTGR